MYDQKFNDRVKFGEEFEQNFLKYLKENNQEYINVGRSFHTNNYYEVCGTTLDTLLKPHILFDSKYMFNKLYKENGSNAIQIFDSFPDIFLPDYKIFLEIKNGKIRYKRFLNYFKLNYFIPIYILTIDQEKYIYNFLTKIEYEQKTNNNYEVFVNITNKKNWKTWI